MFQWLRPAPIPIIGIDITSSAIKMLELAYQKEQWRIINFAWTTIPEYSLNTQMSCERAAIARCFNSASFTSNHVALAISDSEIISKTVSFDATLSAQELEDLVFIEANKFIAHSNDAINVDFEIQGPCVDNPQLIDVFIVASRKEHITNKVNTLSAAGLEAVIIDTHSYAIARASAFLIDNQPHNTSDDVVAVVEINTDTIRLYVMHKQKLVFAREEPFELLDINSIAQFYPWSLDKTPTPISHDNELIVSRAQRMLQFFYSLSSYSIDYLFLAGDGVKHAGLVDLLQTQLNVSSFIANPFLHMSQRIDCDSELLMHEAPSLMSVCGLAMRTSRPS